MARRLLLPALVAACWLLSLYVFGRWNFARNARRIQTLEAQVAVVTVAREAAELRVAELVRRTPPLRVIVRQDSSNAQAVDSLQQVTDSLLKAAANDSSRAAAASEALRQEREAARNRSAYLLGQLAQRDSLLQGLSILTDRLYAENSLLRQEILALQKRPSFPARVLPTVVTVLGTVGACHLARC